MGHEVARAVAPDLRIGVLSGPSFAQEVARQQPTALPMRGVWADNAPTAWCKRGGIDVRDHALFLRRVKQRG